MHDCPHCGDSGVPVSDGWETSDSGTEWNRVRCQECGGRYRVSEGGSVEGL